MISPHQKILIIIDQHVDLIIYSQGELMRKLPFLAFGSLGVCILAYFLVSKKAIESKHTQMNPRGIAQQNPSKHKHEIKSRLQGNFHKEHGHEDAHHGIESVGETFDEIFSDSVVGIMLTQHINHIEDIGPNAQFKLDQRLNQLRDNKKQAGEELRSAYTNASINQFSTRYKIVWTLGMINDPASEAFLGDLATQPIPESIQPYSGHGDINRPLLESNIRMAAIQGVARLAQHTNQMAQGLETILEAIQSTNDRAVKKVGIMTYINHSEDTQEAISYLQEVLPNEDHRLISIGEDEVPDLD